MAYVMLDEKDYKKNNFTNFKSNDVILGTDYHLGKYFLMTEATENMNYYFFYKQNLYSLEKEDSIRRIQKELIADLNYKEAKIYNEYLVNVTRIKKLKKWMFYPMIIQLEHTNRCNARCIMCGHATVNKEKCFDMLDNVFEKIHNMLPFCKYVGLHGYGEPFLYPNLLDVLEIYKRYEVRIYANTNLSYLPEGLIPYIRDIFDEINISLDGLSKNTYEKIRRGLSFEKVEFNLQTLRRQCEYVKVNIHFTMMRQNIHEIVKVVEFAHRYGIKAVVMNEMIPLEANRNERDSIRHFPDIVAYNLKCALEQSQKYKIDFLYPKELVREYDMVLADQQLKDLEKLCELENGTLNYNFSEHEGLLFNRERISSKDLQEKSIKKCQGICDVFQQQIYVDADGTMALCCVDGYHYSGNILEYNNIEEYWDSSVVKSVRACFEDGKLPALCNQCNYILLGNLKNMKVYSYKKINGKD